MFKVDRKEGLKKHSKTNGRKRASVTRTFRINAEWDTILREDAEKRGISVNVLVNLILRKYANFERLCQNYEVISMSKLGFHEIIENIPLENLARAGEIVGSKEIQNMIDMRGLPSNFDSFTHLIEKHYGGKDCANWFNCYLHHQQRSDLLHLQHNLGRGWSIYLEQYFHSYLKKLNIDCKTRVYDYAANIRIFHPR